MRQRSVQFFSPSIHHVWIGFCVLIYIGGWLRPVDGDGVVPSAPSILNISLSVTTKNNGFLVNTTHDNGFFVNTTHDNEFSVNTTHDDGFVVNTTANNGFLVNTTDSNDTFVNATSTNNATTEEDDGQRDNRTEGEIESWIPTKHLVFLVAELVASFLTILFNGLLLNVMYHYKRKANPYLINLAVADLIVGLVVPVLVVLTEVYGWPKEFYTCISTNSIINMLINVSLMSLCAVAVDRMISVRYRRLRLFASRRRFKYSVISYTWIHCFIIGLVLPFQMAQPREQYNGVCTREIISIEYNVFVNFAAFYVPVVVSMLVVHVLIFSTFRESQKRVNRNTVWETRRKQHEVRLAKSLAFIFFVFFIAWSPRHTLSVIEYTNPGLLDATLGSDNYVHLWHTSLVLCHLNSFFNPLVYSLGSADFRRAFICELVACTSCGLMKVSHFKSGASATNTNTQAHIEQRRISRLERQQRLQRECQANPDCKGVPEESSSFSYDDDDIWKVEEGSNVDGFRVLARMASRMAKIKTLKLLRKRKQEPVKGAEGGDAGEAAVEPESELTNNTPSCITVSSLTPSTLTVPNRHHSLGIYYNPSSYFCISHLLTGQAPPAPVSNNQSGVYLGVGVSRSGLSEADSASDGVDDTVSRHGRAVWGSDKKQSVAPRPSDMYLLHGVLDVPYAIHRVITQESNLAIILPDSDHEFPPPNEEGTNIDQVFPRFLTARAHQENRLQMRETGSQVDLIEPRPTTPLPQSSLSHHSTLGAKVSNSFQALVQNLHMGQKSQRENKHKDAKPDSEKRNKDKKPRSENKPSDPKPHKLKTKTGRLAKVLSGASSFAKFSQSSNDAPVHRRTPSIQIQSDEAEQAVVVHLGSHLAATNAQEAASHQL